MPEQSSSRVLKALAKLRTHGWVPLLGMAALLGYNEPRAIYQRQRGRNAIPVVKVGGQYRVYEEAVIKTLENTTGYMREDARMVLAMYRAAKKREKENSSA